MTTFCTTCKLPTLTWWALNGQGGALYKCASPSCGATQSGPAVVENPAMRVKVG